MAEHYYSSTPTSAHNFKEIQTILRGVELTFKTDAGVFSKSRIDTGTKLLIESIKIDPQWQLVFDLGCGYGPIGLTLAKVLPGATVYMSDVNERAVELAKENAQRNGIKNVVIKSGEGYSAVAGISFDFIVTNPPIRAGKQVIYPMVDYAYQFLKPNGWFSAVIATKQGAKSFERKLAEVFGNVLEWEKGSGFRVVASQKLGE
ncbi:MAG TPA: class I SAM-dependent methyltransferase [Bacillota bacterium]|jgi:16S rRNA (guanine1207-N2)-methyltransferase|nr:class I SAM-dependent methyltransferase [Bacillota bacterium]HOL08843.1 class I SAM-dependent methyltransferase [Bacillota bacterium]HPO96536.1 class I SAM-dependent methyltransferase [Bacillota bacterium]